MQIKKIWNSITKSIDIAINGLSIVRASSKDGYIEVTWNNGRIAKYSGSSTVWYTYPYMKRCSTLVEAELCEVAKYIKKWKGDYPDAHKTYVDKMYSQTEDKDQLPAIQDITKNVNESSTPSTVENTQDEALITERKNTLDALLGNLEKLAEFYGLKSYLGKRLESKANSFKKNIPIEFGFYDFDFPQDHRKYDAEGVQKTKKSLTDCVNSIS